MRRLIRQMLEDRGSWLQSYLLDGDHEGLFKRVKIDPVDEHYSAILHVGCETRSLTVLRLMDIVAATGISTWCTSLAYTRDSG